MLASISSDESGDMQGTRRSLAAGMTPMSLDIHLSAMTRKLTWLRGVRRTVRPLRAHYARKYAGRADRMVTISDYDGDIAMTLDRSTYIGGSIYWNGYHHLGEIRYLRKNLASDATFVDVGANQGEFALVAAKVASRGQVLAFEPEDRMFALLQKNVRSNNFENASLFHFGLGSETARAKLFTSSDTVTHGGWNEGLFSAFQDDTRSEFVQDFDVRRLDDVLSEQRIDRVDFIKIAAEGAELFVLRGAYHTLEAFRPTILLEINDMACRAASYRAQDIIEFLERLKYKIYLIKRNGSITIENVLNSVRDHGTINVLCEHS